MSNIPNFTIREMLDSGVHYGHKANRWNPQMSQFIYGSRGDLHIIDLTKTYSLLKKALGVIKSASESNGKILFIGTKRQSAKAIAEHAEKCGQHYVNHRWLGGMLTNWATVSNSIKTLENIEAELSNEESTLTKKERLNQSRKLEKLNRALGGIKEMKGKPSLVIVFDTVKESIAVKEAAKLEIPVIAIVDTNASLENISYPIPGNDDSAKATAFFCRLFSETISKSRKIEEITKEKESTEKTVAKKEEVIVKAEEKPKDKEIKADAKTEEKSKAKVETSEKPTTETKAKPKPAAKEKAESKTADKKEAKPKAVVKEKAKPKAKPTTAKASEKKEKSAKSTAEKKPAKAKAVKKASSKKEAVPA